MAAPWISENAVYQIYPMSFCDANGDGKGDLEGIISKLDYLQSLGIKTIWLSPIYESPMVDMGYDISDYYKINPVFGTMEDFNKLISEMTKRNMKLVMDLVVNHTSDQCEWFKKAIADRDSPYRGYYIFRQGQNGKEPNNWKSSFLGSAWEKVPHEENMYYLHLFSKQQPDLNFHNEKVIQEVEKILAYWMDKGVYGFRCDVISCIYKDSYEDGVKAPLGVPVGQEHYVATPGCHSILKRIRKDVIEPRHGVLIGECLGATLDNSAAFLDHELDTFFTFAHVNINGDKWSKEYVNPAVFKKILVDWQSKIDWNGNYLENHDQHRSISKYVKPGFETVGSKMLLTLIYTLRGTPFIYMGEELGFRDYPSLSYSDCHDCVTQFIFNMATGMHLPKGLAFLKARHNGRDDARYPMAFNDSDGYGFSAPGVIPWQKYNPLCQELNAKTEEADPESTLAYFKKINALRQTSPVLSYGSIRFLEAPKDVLSFIREKDGQKIWVALNLSNKTRKVSFQPGELLLSNTEKTEENKLSPYQAILVTLD